MKKAKIYIPAKTAMQSGRGKIKNWVLNLRQRNSSIKPFNGLGELPDTLEEVILKFSSKEKAIEYAKNITYNVVELKKENLLLSPMQTIF